MGWHPGLFLSYIIVSHWPQLDGGQAFQHMGGVSTRECWGGDLPLSEAAGPTGKWVKPAGLLGVLEALLHRWSTSQHLAWPLANLSLHTCFL